MRRQGALALFEPELFIEERVVKARTRGCMAIVAIVDPIEARPVASRQAHGAGLATGVHLAAFQCESAQSCACLPDGVYLAVRGWIVSCGNTVRSLTDHDAVLHDHRGERASCAAAHVLGGQCDSPLHECRIGDARHLRLLSLLVGEIMDSMAHAFISQRVVTPEGVRPAAIRIEGGKIAAVCSSSEVPASDEVRDFGALAILPGLVDSHVHINEPGRTEWEGFATATRAAAAGGYTTLIDMPLNCLPETTTVQALEAKRAAARGQCLVDWAAWGGVAGDNALDIEPLAAAGVRGFKCFLIYPGCEGFQAVTQAQLEAALPHVARTGLPLLVHAELDGPIQSATAALASADWRRYETYLRSRPDEAEMQAIRMLLDLCRKHWFHLHIVHLATALALDELRHARAEGLPVTVETCPHYLHFAAEEISNGSTLHKCAPPIRSRDNREGLWDAIRDGVIDLVATDHSPCPPSMKGLDEGRFDTAWGGIASLAVALPVMWTGLEARGFTLRDIARLMSEAPAQVSGLSARKGRLAPGYDADLVVFDPEARVTVTVDALHARHRISPYVGEMLRGKVLATFVRGEAVFDNGVFATDRLGIEL